MNTKADALEEEYHRLAGNDQSPIQSTQPANHLAGQASQSCTVAANSSLQSLGQQQNQTSGVSQRAASTTVASFSVAAPAPPVNKPVTLTAEQRAMIEAKRLEALKRRQQRMQQLAASTSYNNPYAK